MRAVVGLLSYFATKRNKSVSLLVSTTGDTGPAAVQAVADTDNPLLTLLVHYPHGQISDFQRRQLTTVRSPRVRVAAFEGGGDDMDRPIKHMLTQQKDKEGPVQLTGVNSYNIGRPLMQTVHYVSCHPQEEEEEEAYRIYQCTSLSVSLSLSHTHIYTCSFFVDNDELMVVYSFGPIFGYANKLGRVVTRSSLQWCCLPEPWGTLPGGTCRKKWVCP